MGESLPRLILILGGARSGKSAYAEQLAARLAGGAPVVYIATATAGDDEMRARIAAHQAHRPTHWVTIEAPLDPAGALQAHCNDFPAPVILLDCITLLVANLLLAEETLEVGDEQAAESHVVAACDALLATIPRPGTLILVANEVGLGIVPETYLGRIYRDVLGRTNARLAAKADLTAFMIAGKPIDLTDLSARWEERLSLVLEDHRE